jgi:hypothetical protein
MSPWNVIDREVVRVEWDKGTQKNESVCCHSK